MSEQQPIDPTEVGKIWDFIGFEGKKPVVQPKKSDGSNPTTNGGASNMEGSSEPSSSGGSSGVLRQRNAAGRIVSVKPPPSAGAGQQQQQQPITGSTSAGAASSSGAAAAASGQSANSCCAAPAPVRTGPPKTFRQKFFSFAPLPWWSLLIFICFFFSEVRWRLNESPCGILGLPDPVNAGQIKRAFRTISL